MTPEEQKIADDLALDMMLMEMGGKATTESPIYKLNQLIGQGWEATYIALFGDKWVAGLAPHHIEAIVWHWESRLDFLQGRYPKYDAYFPIWSRGHQKSGIARRIAIVEGVLSFAYSVPTYVLYLSRTKDMALKHSKSIETLLQTSGVQTWCPKLAQEQVNEQKRSKGWTAKFIYTAANAIYHFAGLEEGMAGGNLETNTDQNSKSAMTDVRVVQFVLDDIDGREDSPLIAENRLKTLTEEVLPMGQDNTLAFFAQNLIKHNSTMYRIWTQQVHVLTGRKPTNPVPAVENFEYETKANEDGIVQDVYISGTPTWDVWDERRIQQEINRFGIDAFKRECLHMVNEDRSGRILHNYRDTIHAISESEFASVYGSVDAWLSWRKKPGNDWAKTKTDKHANVAGWLTKSSEGTAFPGVTFLMYPMSFPEQTGAEDVAERILSCLTPYAYDKVTWAEVRKQTTRRLNADAFTTTVPERMAYEHGELSRIIPKYSKPLLQRCNAQQGDMSHEQDTIRRMYASVYGLGFKPVNPRKYGGVELINSEMAVDMDVEHPFRPGEMGYSRWFIVVPDDTSQAPYRTHNGKSIWRPKPLSESLDTKDLVDGDLARYQITHYANKPVQTTVSGERIDEPEKVYDDVPQMMQMWYVGSQLSGSSLTEGQKLELIMPSEVIENVRDMRGKSGIDKLHAVMEYQFQQDHYARMLNPDAEGDDYE